MIEILIKDEVCSVLNKNIIIKKFVKACNDIGFDIDRYVLTEFFEDGKPSGYKIELHVKE